MLKKLKICTQLWTELLYLTGRGAISLVKQLNGTTVNRAVQWLWPPDAFLFAPSTRQDYSEKRDKSICKTTESQGEMSNCMININSDHLYVAEINNDLGRPGGNCYVHYRKTFAVQTNKNTQPPEALVSVLFEAPCAIVCYTWIWPSPNLRLFFTFRLYLFSHLSIK